LRIVSELFIREKVFLKAKFASRKSFQHSGAKRCGKADNYSFNFFDCNLYYTLHLTGCWHFRGRLNDKESASNSLGGKVKVRLDNLLQDRGLAASRQRAQALILAGKVLVDGQKIEKSGTPVDAESQLRLLGEDLKYVSRGGLKLERALEHWRINVEGKTCLDVGASTGGFTDCLLQRGARRVIAVDTGRGQIDFRLRQDPRVRLLEKTNARYLTRHQVGETVNLVVMDVSFISATLVLPAVIAVALPETAEARRGGQVIVLVKPQFEAGREHVGKGGIVKDEQARQDSVEKVRATLQSLRCTRTEVIDSPILGAQGNREFLLYGLF
jgi:23S rRNA (cytidine1920-2'-O)/16S rRNA (cytidine1409-2'-O)-methyltransferase